MKNNLVRLLSIMTILVLLASCNFVRSTPTETAATSGGETTAAPATPATEAAASFTILPGTLMRWWDGSTFVFVPAGTFIMGDEEAVEGDNIPAHEVSVDGFWMHRSEVTNQMYAQCVAAGICAPPLPARGTANHFGEAGYQNHPVVNVTWQDAVNYCEWIGGRLPTEAEWEWAARGDSGDPYPWGDEDPSCGHLNYAECAIRTFTVPVNSYPLGLSPFYAADMAGNVFEWVHDWYGEDYYAQSPSSNPGGPETGEQRVVRSSGFRTVSSLLPVTRRFSDVPEASRDDLGFRCLLTGEAAGAPPLPVCQTLAYVPPSQNPLDSQPDYPAPMFAMWTYCGLDNNGNQYGVVVLHFENTDLANLTISSPNGTLNCTQDVNDPMQFTCTGSAPHPGDQVEVLACYPPSPQQQAILPICPVFYEMNPVTNQCEYTGTNFPVQCIAPYIHVPGYDCVPPPNQNGDCPAGYVAAEYNTVPVCIPSNGPTCIGQDCPAACPPGLTFNQNLYCCDWPQDITPSCPVGYVYEESTNFCVPQSGPQVNCTGIAMQVPTCAPDQPDEPDQPGPTGCLIRSVTGGLVCVSPCPPGAPNYGACTP